jgi:hypothetical protein
MAYIDIDVKCDQIADGRDYELLLLLLLMIRLLPVLPLLLLLLLTLLLLSVNKWLYSKFSAILPADVK